MLSRRDARLNLHSLILCLFCSSQSQLAKPSRRQPLEPLFLIPWRQSRTC